MSPRMFPLFFVLILIAVPARAQESLRQLSGPGQYG